MTDEIRRAMDARLSSLEASPERRARIRAQCHQEEKPKVKRRLYMAVVVAIALMIALGGIGVAEMTGFNLFDFFARNTRQAKEHFDIDQQTLNDLQEKSTLISASSSPMEVEALEGYIRLHDAYYDGDVLFLGNIAREERYARVVVAWTPTEEELAGHEPEAWPIWPREAASEQEREIIGAFDAAREARRPYGFKRYQYSRLMAGCRTAEGTQVMPIGSRSMATRDGVAYVVQQMQSPLPEEIRQKEIIEIELTAPMTVEYHWFDGEKYYYWSEAVEPVVGTATIVRSKDARQLRYQGEPGVLDGVTVTAEAIVSPYLAHVVFRAKEPVFLPGEAADWCVSVVDDGTGEELSGMYERLTYQRPGEPGQTYVFYQMISEDGLTCERYVSLSGDMPGSLTLTVGRDGAEAARFVVRPTQ